MTCAFQAFLCNWRKGSLTACIVNMTRPLTTVTALLEGLESLNPAPDGMKLLVAPESNIAVKIAHDSVAWWAWCSFCRVKYHAHC